MINLNFYLNITNQIGLQSVINSARLVLCAIDDALDHDDPKVAVNSFRDMDLDGIQVITDAGNVIPNYRTTCPCGVFVSGCGQCEFYQRMNGTCSFHVETTEADAALYLAMISTREDLLVFIDDIEKHLGRCEDDCAGLDY